MEIIESSLDFQLNRETAVAIGKFDGVHVGHRRLLEEILAKKKEGLQACVFTFDVSPAVLFGVSDGKVLTTREEKRRIFQELGVDVLVEFPMTLQTAATEPEDFARLFLSNALSARIIAAGEDLSFGRMGRGDAALLKRLAGELGFEVKTIPKIKIGDTEVSSTYVRSLLEQGDLEQAERFLGEPYAMDGVVTRGHQIGHTLGFPTINILPAEEKLLPPFGVYFSRARVGDRLYPAISNIGRKPTISGRERIGVETFLYDFEGDLYGREVQVYLHKFCRPERKFEDLEALKAQISQDIATGRSYHQLGS